MPGTPTIDERFDEQRRILDEHQEELRSIKSRLTRAEQQRADWEADVERFRSVGFTDEQLQPYIDKVTQCTAQVNAFLEAHEELKSRVQTLEEDLLEHKDNTTTAFTAVNDRVDGNIARISSLEGTRDRSRQADIAVLPAALGALVGGFVGTILLQWLFFDWGLFERDTLALGLVVGFAFGGIVFGLAGLWAHFGPTAQQPDQPADEETTTTTTVETTPAEQAPANTPTAEVPAEAEPLPREQPAPTNA